MLQYVLVKDLQTGSSYYFLVEEWLSVDNERTGGQVEIEVEASGKGLRSDRGRQTAAAGRLRLISGRSFCFRRGGRASSAASPPAV